MQTIAFDMQTISHALNNYADRVNELNASIERRRDFDVYNAVRRANGDQHLNQAFDPQFAAIDEDDFWLLARNERQEPIATYCLRRFLVDDFYDVIRSLTLWFSKGGYPVVRQFVVECRVPPFGGEVVHGGGLWVRPDYRGASRLAAILPRLARALAFRDRPFDHDCAMIRDDPHECADVAGRKAIFMGKRVYGYARVQPFVDGWFPPEARCAVMYLCHATKAEAIASLALSPRRVLPPSTRTEFRQRPLVDQHDQPVYAAAVLSQRQEQASIGI